MRKKKECDDRIVFVKCSLITILRKDYVDNIQAYISNASLQSSKICVLASLLFLHKVQSAFDNKNMDDKMRFFADGDDRTIKNCFYGVLSNYIAKNEFMDPEFRTLAENIDDEHQFTWPNNSYFGNAFGELMTTYITNVKNNLNMHCKKRLTQYLKMRVFLHNQGDFHLFRYDSQDIKNAVSFAMFERDFKCNSIEAVARRERRSYLLQMITDISIFEIPNCNVAQFTKHHWFKSLQMWIAIQRQIDVFNTELRQDFDHCAKIRNLTVIPICKPKRHHYTIDTETLYKMFCSTNLIARENGRQITSKQVSMQILSL